MRQYMLSPTGAPELKVFRFMIPSSYLAGSAGHGKTDTAEFLTCAFLVVN